LNDGQETKGIGKVMEKVAGNEKYRRLLIILGLGGIALIFLSGFFHTGDGGGKDEELPAVITVQEYANQLQNSLTEIVSSIDGAGETKVMVTLENGPETKYATEEKTSSQNHEERTAGDTTRVEQTGDSEVKYITVRDADGAERALAITEFQPTVKGVVIVCAGGEQPIVQQRIVNAVTTALNISSKRVCVTRLS
jgi:stage III sporulation protein AG